MAPGSSSPEAPDSLPGGSNEGAGEPAASTGAWGKRPAGEDFPRAFSWKDGRWDGPLVVALAALLVALFWNWAGLRVTVSGSLPSGIYIETPEAPSRGSIVLLCPPDGRATRLALRRGYFSEGHCPTGSKPLGKPVAGLPGDTVTLTTEGIFVNGERVKRSRPYGTDSRGRHVPVALGRWVLPKKTYYLFSDYRPRHSYDSRYVGPVRGDAQVVRPVWTF